MHQNDIVKSFEETVRDFARPIASLVERGKRNQMVVNDILQDIIDWRAHSPEDVLEIWTDWEYESTEAKDLLRKAGMGFHEISRPKLDIGRKFPTLVTPHGVISGLPLIRMYIAQSAAAPIEQ